MSGFSAIPKPYQSSTQTSSIKHQAFFIDNHFLTRRADWIAVQPELAKRWKKCILRPVAPSYIRSKLSFCITVVDLEEDITRPQDDCFNYHDHFRYVIGPHVQQGFIRDERVEPAPSKKEHGLSYRQIKSQTKTQGGRCAVCKKWTPKFTPRIPYDPFVKLQKMIGQQPAQGCKTYRLKLRKSRIKKLKKLAKGLEPKEEEVCGARNFDDEEEVQRPSRKKKRRIIESTDGNGVGEESMRTPHAKKKRPVLSGSNEEDEDESMTASYAQKKHPALFGTD